MVEDRNEQATAAASSDRKRLTGSQKRKLRRQGFCANEAASSATALQSPVSRAMAPKRRKGPKDPPPSPRGMRSPKRPKPVRLAANTELADVGPLAAQRTNPLTVIVADSGYPESVLSPEQFEFFREATLHGLDKEQASSWQRFETSFCRGGVFIFVALNLEAKAWLTKTVADFRPWEGANLKVSGVEIIKKMLKATAWIPGKPEDPAVVLRRLEGFNPSLKRASWRIVRHERPQEANVTAGLKHHLIVQVQSPRREP